MKRTLFSLLLLLPLTAAAHADDASKRTKIVELLTLLKADQVSKQIIDGAGRQTDAIGHRQFGATETAEQQKQVEDLHQQVLTIITPAIEWKALQPDVVAIYNTAYTEPELDGILAFFRTPSGQAFLTKDPEVRQKSDQLIRTHMSTVQPQLQQLVQQFVAKTTPAAGASPAGKSPSTTPNRPAPTLTTPSTAPPSTTPSTTPKQ